MKNGFSGTREVYLEIAERYEQYIRLGVLKDGEKLPSVRTVAGELGVNPNTVQRAFRHLEENGLLKSLPKKGIYVQHPTSDESEKKNSDLFETILSLKNKKVSFDDLLTVIKEVYEHD